MRYSYPCQIVRDVDEAQVSGQEAFVVSFRDVEPAITGGWSWSEAVDMASDCLGVALGFYVTDDEDLPLPSSPQDGEVMISVAPLVAAKLAVYTAMREQGLSRASLAEKLDMDDESLRRLLDPRYRTHLTIVERALAIVGRSLVVEDCSVASPPEAIIAGSES